MPLLSRLAVQAARAYGVLSSKSTNVSASYLVVAGGGGGGSRSAGGGGAGGRQGAETAGDAGGDQGRQALRVDAARANPPPVGSAGDRRGVGPDRSDQQVRVGRVRRTRPGGPTRGRRSRPPRGPSPSPPRARRPLP